jgi:hypothetical protein
MTVEFTGTVRRFHEDKPGGLAVVDVPADVVAAAGDEVRLVIERAAVAGSQRPAGPRPPACGPGPRTRPAPARSTPPWTPAPRGATTVR